MTSAVQKDSTRTGFGQTHKHTTAEQHRMEMLACRCAHDTDVTSNPYLCFKVNMDRTYSIFMLTSRKTRFDVCYWCQGIILLVVSVTVFINSNLALFLVFASSVCITVSAMLFKECADVCISVFMCVCMWYIVLMCGSWELRRYLWSLTSRKKSSGREIGEESVKLKELACCINKRQGLTERTNCVCVDGSHRPASCQKLK